MTVEHFVWKGIEQGTLERCEIASRAGELIVTSEITGNMSGEEVALSYRIILDKQWNVQSFAVQNDLSNPSFYFSARQFEKGKWKNDRDEVLDAFDNCVDIDIFPTPFTNSLPLKREPLMVGEHREYKMMWIDLLEGAINPNRQRYQRVSSNVYQFTSLDKGFTADIEFTEGTIVKFYPGLFELVEK